MPVSLNKVAATAKHSDKTKSPLGFKVVLIKTNHRSQVGQHRVKEQVVISCCGWTAKHLCQLEIASIYTRIAKMMKNADRISVT